MLLQYRIFFAYFFSTISTLYAMEKYPRYVQMDSVQARHYLSTNLPYTEEKFHDIRKFAEAFLVCISDGQQGIYLQAAQFAHELINYPPKNHRAYNSLLWYTTLYIEDALKLYIALIDKEFDQAYEHAAQGIITALFDKYSHDDAFRLLCKLVQLDYEPAQWYSLQSAKQLIQKKRYDISHVLNILIDSGYQPAIDKACQWIKESDDLDIAVICLLPLVRNKHTCAFNLACNLVCYGKKNKLLRNPFWRDLIDTLIIADYEPIHGIALEYVIEEWNHQDKIPKNITRQITMLALCKNLENLIRGGYEPAYETATNFISSMIDEKEIEQAYLGSQEKDLLFLLIEKKYIPACTMIQGVLNRKSTSICVFWQDLQEKLSKMS